MRSFAAAVVVTLLALPAVSPAKHYYSELCAPCAADGASSRCTQALPPDPRRLVTHENGYTSEFIACHDAIPDGYAMPNGEELTWLKEGVSTCADWLAFAAEGKRILEQEALIGSVGFGNLGSFRNLWQAWGLEERPANFDDVVVERYGLQRAPFDNPYPTDADLAAGDAWKTSGGSGQLPMGFVQNYRQDAGGGKEYTGQMGVTCLFCHSGRVELPGETKKAGTMGLGNNTFDAELYHKDVEKAGGGPTPLPYPHNITRGAINAVSDFEFLAILRDFDTLDVSPFVKTMPVHASPGDQDPPNWWNTGMRPRVYMDGGVPADNTRALMMFLSANVGQNGAWIENNEQLFEYIATFVSSVEPPAFPALAGGCDPDQDGGRCLDPAKVAEGRQIFHSKNLFSAGNELYGNGSCASCHGVYEPQYAKPAPEGPMPPETAGLSQAERESLVGIAGHIVPRNFIGTDPGRVDNLTRELRYGWSTTWWAYPDFVEGYTPPEDKDPLTEWLDDYASTPESNAVASAVLPARVEGVCSWEQETYGYAAPPLHGVWSSAPYFHNGSAPTVWHVLNPGERPRFWRRRLSEGITLANGEVEAGYATSLDAYDFERLGWQIDSGAFADCGAPPLVPCDDELEPLNFAIEQVLWAQGGGVWLGHQWPDPETRADIERRKIYDTRLYGKSNRGHTFTSVLTDDERRALIEYLKTL